MEHPNKAFLKGGPFLPGANMPIAINWKIQHVEGNVFSAYLCRLDMHIATKWQGWYLWKRHQHQTVISNFGLFWKKGPRKRGETCIQTLCLATGSFGVHGLEGHFSGEQDLLPPSIIFSFFVNMFLVSPNRLITSTPEQRFLGEYLHLLPPPVFLFCQTISTSVVL